MDKDSVVCSSKHDEKEFLGFRHPTTDLFLVKNPQSETILTTKKCAASAGYSNPIDYLGVNDYQLRCSTVKLAGEFLNQDKRALQSNVTQGYILFTTYANADTGVYLYTKESHNNCVICNLWRDDNSPIAKHLYGIINNTNACSLNNINICFDIIMSYDNLTQTESKIMYFLMQGLSSTNIGKLIHLSKRTIQHYIEHIKHKTGCNTTSQLIQMGLMLQYNKKIPIALVGSKVRKLLFRESCI